MKDGSQHYWIQGWKDALKQLKSEILESEHKSSFADEKRTLNDLFNTCKKLEQDYVYYMPTIIVKKDD